MRRRRAIAGIAPLALEERPMVRSPVHPARSFDEIRRAWKNSWAVVVVASLLVMPLFVVCVWLYANDRWAPTFDLALTELRFATSERFTPSSWACRAA
jgi:hypothetical protein